MPEVTICLKTGVKEVISVLETDFPEVESVHPFSQEDSQFLAKIESGIHQLPDGHYQMPLPFKGDKAPTVSNNKPAAPSRLNQLKSKFRSNPQLKTKYAEFMEKIIAAGDVEVIGETERQTEKEGHLWYLSHFAVFGPKSEKIRVFDCRAQYLGRCLYDYLLQGPDMMNSLVGVLCRFRHEPVAVTCDVARMFHQFRVNREDRDYLRFLWWPGGDESKPTVEYRSRVFLFGLRCAPACCAFGLKQIASDFKPKYGEEAADFIMRQFYVDDGLGSKPTIEGALSLIKSAQEACGEGGLHLPKIASNCREVLESIPEEDRLPSLRESELPMNKGELSYPLERVLGIQWCIENDTLTFRIVLKDRPLTRRGILSTIGSIYDPLGMAAPVLLVGKMILQELCRENADWDTPLSENLRMDWEKWRSELPHLEQLSTPRCYKPGGFGEVASASLHHFSDASSRAYGQCSYVRLVSRQGDVHCSFIMGKARVTPLKPLTIPRLELTAALTSVRISTMLTRELDYKIAEQTFWTDSKVVMGYIANEERRYHVFVANRVQEIRKETEPSQWRHVASEENVADEASRGLNPEQLASGTARWLRGPDFLWERELPKAGHQEVEEIEDDPEVKREITGTVLAVNVKAANMYPSLLERLSSFSSWEAAKTAIAICLRYRDRLLGKQDATIKQRPLAAEDMQRAEREILNAVQLEAFAEEIGIIKDLEGRDGTGGENVKVIKASSPLYKLDPFIDRKRNPQSRKTDTESRI
ncbi:uncharacterized protein LOC135482978 [Lineus longissimus]|uniref:uncharacterized protein LOC135482978 n=1 Tax=Lineus longissimus TaxID=88925 RepID=UPI00315CDAF8